MSSDLVKVQLCKLWPIGRERNNDYIVEPKIDGVRCLILKEENKKAIAYSRQRKPLNNIDLILEQVNEMKGSFMLDGELIGDSFSNTVSIVRTNEGYADGDDLDYTVWDYVPLGAPFETLIKRKEALREALDSIDPISIIETEWRTLLPIHDELVVLEYYLHKGFEGIVIKDPLSTYTNGRRVGWWKLKKMKDMELVCYDLIEGEGKYEGMLGAIKVASGDISCKVGSGFDDAQREHFWNTPADIVGKRVTVQYQQITQARGSKERSLRFPIFVCVRDYE